MKVLLDTVVVLGLINRRDQYHREASLLHGELRSKRATILLQRIAGIEFIGHATRLSKAGTSSEVMRETRISMLESMTSLEAELVDHVADDYAVAEKWWRQYADWPIDYPDALIAATALRLNVDRVWTFDAAFVRFLIRAVPGIGLIRQPHQG